MAGALVVRPLAANDRRAWDELWAGYLAFYEAKLDPAVTETTWRRLTAPVGDMRGFVAEINGRLIGLTHYLMHPSTWSINGYCYLEDLFVSDAVRAQGVGRALIAAVEGAAREAGCSRLYWSTHTDNARARRLYDDVAEFKGFIKYQKQL
jgi:GNAT superfamily N-acetyltransferase